MTLVPHHYAQELAGCRGLAVYPPPACLLQAEEGTEGINCQQHCVKIEGNLLKIVKPNPWLSGNLLKNYSGNDVEAFLNTNIVVKTSAQNLISSCMQAKEGC